MSIKSFFAKRMAAVVARKVRAESERGIELQQQVLQNLVSTASGTAFGQAHRFSDIDSHRAFAEAVPVGDYEQFSPWIERVKQGEKDVLGPGQPLYFCKTSGTTSGTKYIPLTKDSMPNHIGSARNALLMYIAETGQAAFVDGKMIFLQGSPKLDKLPSGIPFGRLSGIVANHVPSYLQKNRMPSYGTNCIEDWETKVNTIADETLKQDMRLISGIPSWVQMYFEILLKKTGKSTVRDIFPNFSLFVYGGVNYEPYRHKFVQLIGENIPSIELFPASEGFIAYQDSRDSDGLLLNVNSGIFFEFIPADLYFKENPPRLSLAEVKVGVNYVLILSNNAGLWGYNIGDTVRFVSLDPPRIKVTGRIKHFTSAFGEHVIAEEVESAMSEACREFNVRVREFHVAPQLHPANGLPYHEWLVEFDETPSDLQSFAMALDNKMTVRNVYYKDLIKGHVLRTLVITPVAHGAFQDYMKSIGKLGGQNKVPRLANDRNIAERLLPVH
ncbi:MAG: GH3 auxin-responsive promoter family protein [Flavobacteriales bacterium]|nr:GH3 auxin-responsive promoter family protein [Flavobacteriales bacterium]